MVVDIQRILELAKTDEQIVELAEVGSWSQGAQLSTRTDAIYMMNEYYC